MLQDVGGENQLKPVKKDGKLSPYYHEDASVMGSVQFENFFSFGFVQDMDMDGVR